MGNQLDRCRRAPAIKQRTRAEEIEHEYKTSRCCVICGDAKLVMVGMGRQLRMGLNTSFPSGHRVCCTCYEVIQDLTTNTHSKSSAWTCRECQKHESVWYEPSSMQTLTTHGAMFCVECLLSYKKVPPFSYREQAIRNVCNSK